MGSEDLESGVALRMVVFDFEPPASVAQFFQSFCGHLGVLATHQSVTGGRFYDMSLIRVWNFLSLNNL